LRYRQAEKTQVVRDVKFWGVTIGDQSENTRRKAPKIIGGRKAGKFIPGRRAGKGHARTQGPLRGDEESSIANPKKLLEDLRRQMIYYPQLIMRRIDDGH